MLGDDPIEAWRAEQTRYDAEVASIALEQNALPVAPSPARYAAAAAQLVTFAAAVEHADDDSVRALLETVGRLVVGPEGCFIRYDDPFSDFIAKPFVAGW